MTSLKTLFGIRDTRRSRRRRLSLGDLRPEALEPRAMLAVTVPPNITGDFIEIDDNVLVAADVDGKAAAIEATASYLQIFGNSRGRIDAVSRDASASLVLRATSSISVSGAIGAETPFDSLTLWSTSGGAVSLGQAVTLDDDLTVTKAGSVTFREALVIGDGDGQDDLTIADATNVMFAGNVAVTGDLVIAKATTVTFAGTLTVGGRLRIGTALNPADAVRFLSTVSVGAAEVTSRDRVFVQGDFTSTGNAGTGDVTFTAEQVGFNSAVIATAAAVPTATLTIQPLTADRAIAIGSPPGVAAGLNITDTALTAIQAGWKRVVFGRELDGTGAVTIGSIGSQQGSSQLLNTTTIVGGSIVVDDSVEVVLPVDVTSQAAYLDLVARGLQGITVNAPINQTADERNAWLRLTAAGPIAINAPIWATDTVSLTTTNGGTITQQLTAAAAITAPKLVVVADGAVTLADSGNAFDVVAILTTGDSVVLREDSGYEIGTVTTTDTVRATPAVTVSGIVTGSTAPVAGTVRLVTVSGATASTVSQTKKILAAALGLEGSGTDWGLASLASDHNDVDTLAAKTGSVAFRDADDLTIGTVPAVAPRVDLSGIDVARTVTVVAGTTLSILAAGDIVSAATSDGAVDLTAAAGISTAGDVTTKGASVVFRDATTLVDDVVIDVVDGANTGTVRFSKAVTGAGALTITGKLDAAASLGEATALKSLSVSGDATLAGGITVRTVGDQTFSGKATSGGTVTVQAGSGATVRFLGVTTLGGLVTRTTDTADYSVELTGSEVTISDAVEFRNTGTVTLGDGATDDLWFKAGVESKLPSGTSLGGTIRTTNAAATFGQKTPANHAITLLADTTVSTGSGAATFWGTVDGAKRLVVNASGDTTFSSAVGGTTALAHVETDAPGRTLLDGGSVTTDSPNSQRYNDAVILGADTVLTAGGGGAITFANTLDGNKTLAINTQGTTTFSKAVGGTTPLVSLTTDKGGTTAIDGGSITTSGSAGQVYGDAVVIGVQAATLTAGVGTVTFNGTVDSAADAARGLTVTASGLTTFNAAVGATKALDSLTVDGTGTTAIDGGSITTSGTAGQVYKDAVTLGKATVLSDTGTGPVTFEKTLTGPYALTVTAAGTTTFGDTVSLASLLTDGTGTTAIDGGSITTSGSAGQVYKDAVTLGKATVLSDTGTGPVTFEKTLTGPYALTVTAAGTTTFGDSVSLASLLTDGTGTTAIDGGSITTSGSAGQVYKDAVTLGKATVLSDTGTGPVTFEKTLTGPYALTVTAAGTTTFGDSVSLASLLTDGTGTTAIDGGSITTSGSAGQVYKDAVTLGKATVLSDTGTGPVTFEKTLTGPYALTVTAAGTTTFGDSVSLASLLTDGTGTTAINGASVATSGSAGQVYKDSVTLGNDTTLTGDKVTTHGTVTGNGNALTIDGTATLGDAAEDTVTGISSLTVTGDATVNASKVAATVIQTWKKQVTLGTDATFENAVIWFQGSIVGAGKDLTLTGTSVTLGDTAADSVTGVDDLVVNGPTVLTGNTVSTTGTQTFNGPVTVTNATAVALTGKGIDFKQAVDRGDTNTPAPPLTITANGGGVKFGGDVGTQGRRFGAVTVGSQGAVSLAGTLWSNAAVKIASTQNAISGVAGSAIRTDGTIRLEAATGIGTRAVPIGIEAASVSAATTSGGIFLTAVEPTGNLWIGADGLVAPAGPIGLSARNTIGVYAGGRIRAGTAGVTAPIPVTWYVDRTTDGGPGSLRQVLLNLNEVGDANKSGLDARVVFDVPRVATPASLVFRIATPLPELRAAVEIIGWGVELQSTGAGAPNGLILGAAASGSTLQGLTLRDFREYGIQLRSAQGVTVDRVAVRSLNLITSMGLYATGDLARTRITGSEFTGGLRGMLLDGARNLRVGAGVAVPGSPLGNAQGNLFANNRAVASQPTFAGTGIRAQGNCAGTLVEGNTFQGNNYGFGFQSAQGLALRGNFFARSSIAAIFVDGNCTGSSQSGNTFGTGVNANKTNIGRARNARGV